VKYVFNLLKSFIKEEDGMGTVEIILIIAVLVGIALVFRNQIIVFVNGMMKRVFPDPDKLDNNSSFNNEHLTTGTGN
jgi:Flp pilus assembly pilin Flp